MISSGAASVFRAAIGPLVLVTSLAGCQREALRSFEGITVGEVVRMVAPMAGQLATIGVGPGAAVEAGSQPFSLSGDESAAPASGASALLKKEDDSRETGDRAWSRTPVQPGSVAGQPNMFSPGAPVSGMVTETLFRRGDWVPAGAPVLSILPVEKIRVRFEVPLSVAGEIHSGQRVKVECAQCEGSFSGTVIHVSSFATEESARLGGEALRYRVEVRPDPQFAAALEPGRHVTVHL